MSKTDIVVHRTLFGDFEVMSAEDFFFWVSRAGTPHCMRFPANMFPDAYSCAAFVREFYQPLWEVVVL